MGRGLVEALLARGDEVTVFSRGLAADPFGDRVARLVGDRDDREAFRSTVASSGDWDAVVDFISFTPEHAADAVRALAGRAGHFVHVSTGSVYAVGRREHDGPLCEADAEAPPVPRWPGSERGWDYGMGKRGAEEALKAAYAAGGFPETRLRLPIVQGPWDYTLRSWRYQLWLESGEPVDLPGGGGWRFTHVYSGDVVAGILAVLTAGAGARGKAYNLAQDETPSLRSYLEEKAAILGLEPRLREVPLARWLEGSMDRSWQPFASWLGRDSILDNSAAKADLGWRPTPMAEWLPLTCDWFSGPENPYERPPNPPWE